MNLAALQWAYELSGLTPVEQAVLANLAFHAHKGELTAFPSIATMARETKFANKTLRRGVTKLKGRGLMTVEPQWDAKGGRIADLYTLITTAAPLVTLTSPPGHADQPPWSQRPAPLVTAGTPYKEEVGIEMGIGSGTYEMGRSNSKTSFAPANGQNETITVVPEIDDPELAEKVSIWNAEIRPPMKAVFGRTLAQHVLDAWAEFGLHGDPPDDGVFRRWVRLQAVNGNPRGHSFASALRVYAMWQDDLDEADNPFAPSYTGKAVEA